MIKYGNFEAYPAVWNDKVGYVLFNEQAGWREMPTVELNQNAGIMTKAAFEAEYGKLPPLPADLTT